MTVFVDTAGWVALTWAQDAWHSDACHFLGTRPGFRHLVTSEAVIGEVVTVLRIRAGHRLAVSFLDYLEGAGEVVEIIDSNADLREEAGAIFRKAADQAFSFVDCQSFAIMRRMRIQEVLTFDQDFLRFGFSVLPGPGMKRGGKKG